MKITKRFLAILLSALMILGTFAVGAGAAQATFTVPFTYQADNGSTVASHYAVTPNSSFPMSLFTGDSKEYFRIADYCWDIRFDSAITMDAALAALPFTVRLPYPNYGRLFRVSNGTTTEVPYVHAESGYAEFTVTGTQLEGTYVITLKDRNFAWSNQFVSHTMIVALAKLEYVQECLINPTQRQAFTDYYNRLHDRLEYTWISTSYSTYYGNAITGGSWGGDCVFGGGTTSLQFCTETYNLVHAYRANGPEPEVDDAKYFANLDQVVQQANQAWAAELGVSPVPTYDPTDYTSGYNFYNHWFAVDPTDLADLTEAWRLLETFGGLVSVAFEEDMDAYLAFYDGWQFYQSLDNGVYGCDYCYGNFDNRLLLAHYRDGSLQAELAAQEAVLLPLSVAERAKWVRLYNALSAMNSIGWFYVPLSAMEALEESFFADYPHLGYYEYTDENGTYGGIASLSDYSEVELNDFIGRMEALLDYWGCPRVTTNGTTQPATTQLTSPQGVLVDDPNYLLPAGATLSVVPKDNIDSGVVSGTTIACWDITILKANGTPYTAYPLSGKVELLLPVPSTYTGNINSLKVYHNGVAIPKADCTPVTIDGKQYIKVLVDSFSPFALVEEASGGTTTTTTQKWWEKLPSFVQWLLRIFAFGWIWMK